MIKPSELQKKAFSEGVRDQQIEKDYVLSWILKGVSENHNLKDNLIFKGGTVLKKFYFQDYRFSEDLDFTIIDSETSNEFIFQCFADVFDYIKEEANIPLEIIDDNEHEDGGINFYISYTGPLGGLASNKKIKIDISKTELMVFEPILKSSFKEYSDLDVYELNCYTLEEVLVEKLRSVIQRMQARDYYDIWYLLEVFGLYANFYTNEFVAKCKHKGVDPKSLFVKLKQRVPQYKGQWEATINDQIKDLPEFEQVDREVQRNLRKLKEQLT
ncbi:MAG: nucleotidyl transferase AbiEii/AbiGii toxin family protein [Bacilli bacterium]|nr:nucleotidyl transferase AbiEii/AbiGii toxin family protein [Bacilli bacterium]